MQKQKAKVIILEKEIIEMPEVPSIEKLCPDVKNDKKLQDIKQDEKSLIEYEKMLKNYKHNFLLRVREVLFTYERKLEKNKELSISDRKKVINSVKKIMKQYICERFEKLLDKAKKNVRFNKFKQEVEKKVGCELIDSVTARKMLKFGDNISFLNRIKKAKWVRQFKFEYANNFYRYYFPKCDIEKLVEEDKKVFKEREIKLKIKKLKREIHGLEVDIKILESIGRDTTREMENLEIAQALLGILEKNLEEMKE